MTYREAARKLARLGCNEIPGVAAAHIANGPILLPTARPSFPDHGGQDLRLGTLRAVVRQLGLDWAAFEQA